MSLYEVLTAKTINENEFQTALATVQSLFKKLIDRDIVNRKKVADLVVEMPNQTPLVDDWDQMPPVGSENF